MDDIVMIWPQSNEALNSFLTALNEGHPTIQFISDYSQTHMNLLEVLVTKDKNGNLETAL